MANKIVQLVDKNGDNVYPLAASDLGTAKITMTSTDPGEGQPLAENNFVAVYDNGLGSLLDMFYPVGSYYETSNTSFDPNVSWGGTWVEDSAGYTTVAYASGDTNFGTVGGTGGSKTHKHLLPILTDNAINWGAFSWNTGINDGGNERRTASNTNILNHTPNTGSFNGYQLYSSNATALQPYIVVKRWHRTA